MLENEAWKSFFCPTTFQQTWSESFLGFLVTHITQVSARAERVATWTVMMVGFFFWTFFFSMFIRIHHLDCLSSGLSQFLSCHAYLLEEQLRYSQRKGITETREGEQEVYPHERWFSFRSVSFQMVWSPSTCPSLVKLHRTGFRFSFSNSWGLTRFSSQTDGTFGRQDGIWLSFHFLICMSGFSLQELSSSLQIMMDHLSSSTE